MPAAPAPQPPATIDITIPEDAPEAHLPAFLLAILAVPPTSAEDTRWHETREILKLRIAHLPTPADQGLENGLPFTRALLHRKETTAFVRVGRALAAAHALIPSIGRHNAALLGIPTGSLPAAFRRRRKLSDEIERTMWHETAAAEAAALRGERPLPPRMPSMGESGAAPKNFITRVLKPARPVMHLATAFAVLIDMVEQQLIQTLERPRVWEAKGFGTIHVDDGHGVTTPRPNIPATAMLQMPGLAREVIAQGETYLPAVRASLSEGRAKPVRMVRLLLE